MQPVKLNSAGSGDGGGDSVAPVEDSTKDAQTPAAAPAAAAAVANVSPPPAAVATATQGLQTTSSSDATGLMVPTAEPTALARVTALLPLGNYAVIEVQGSSCGTADEGEASSGGGGGSRVDGRAAGAAVGCLKERKLLRLDDRVELVGCRGEMLFLF